MEATDYDEGEAEEDYYEYMWNIKNSWLEEYRNEKENGEVSLHRHIKKDAFPQERMAF
ncbi:hypothetical protein [uncultured Eubacterium sp.]|uniref:hypothetical protein n=1 Tax=uncultured Eubacterium sp. TaxID=165185 RepID=UPI0025955B23|nr:hypothetical protein [uncultured Eubacterium sp.]